MGTVRYTTVDGEMIAEKRGGVRSLYVPDALGSTVALLNSAQTVTDTFSYWPYGEVSNRTGTTPTPFQFVGTAGYYQDNSSKTYVRARVLNTFQGRWMTQDPIGFKGDEYNLYRYVNNRPTVGVDPSGLLDYYITEDGMQVGRNCQGGKQIISNLIGNWIGLGYGKCCGPLRIATCNGAVPITQGDDCFDKACCKHDCCLATFGDFISWRKQQVCNKQLCDDVRKCTSFDCWFSPHKLGCLTARASLILYACYYAPHSPGGIF